MLVIGLGLVGAGYVNSQYSTQVGWTDDQPVPFSHRHHAGELGLDCRYCHSSVETSAMAGLPPTQTCMTCHSQIWTGAEALAKVRESFVTGQPIRWRRVAQLPDYVYFNHAVHVTNGVACVECHGRVDQMPLTWRAKPFQMQFCVSCHEDPVPRLRPPEMATRMDWSAVDAGLLEQYRSEIAAHRSFDLERLRNCETCHR